MFDESAHPRHDRSKQFVDKANSSPEGALPVARPHADLTVVEVDAELDRLGFQAAIHASRLDGARKVLARSDEVEADPNPRTRLYILGASSRADWESTVAAESEKLDAIQNEMNTYNDEFDARGGWSRFFLVTNTGGHVHSSTSCSTCSSDTQFGWLTEHSGKDEAEIIDAAGDRACTVCFPDAPVADRNNPRPNTLETPDQRIAREEREAAKAVREAKRQATGIWTSDGEELRAAGKWGRVIKTERTAEIEAVDNLAHQSSIEFLKTQEGWEHLIERGVTQDDLDRAETVDRIVAALAAKRGVTEQEVRDRLTEKAAKKWAKQRREY